jgi:ankyrin repeat protein
MLDYQDFSKYFDNLDFKAFLKDHPNFDFNQKTDPSMPASKSFFQVYALSDVTDDNKEKALKFMLEHGADVDQSMMVGGYETTLLSSAMNQQNLLLADFLIKNNANLLIPFKDATVLHYIAQQPGYNYLFEAVKSQLKNMNQDISHVLDKFGNNPLMVSIRNAYKNTSNIYVPLLMEYTNDLSISNTRNENVFHCAAQAFTGQNMHFERLIVKQLKNGPDKLLNLINQESKQFHTPLDFANGINPSAIIPLILHGAKHGRNSKVYAIVGEIHPDDALESFCSLDGDLVVKICHDINKIYKEAFNKSLIPENLFPKIPKNEEQKNKGKNENSEESMPENMHEIGDVQTMQGYENLNRYKIPTKEELLKERGRTSLENYKKEDKKNDPLNSKDEKAKIKEQLDWLKQMFLRSKKVDYIDLYTYVLDKAIENKLPLTDKSLTAISLTHTNYPQLSQKLINLGLKPNVPLNKKVPCLTPASIYFFNNMKPFIEKNGSEYFEAKKLIENYETMGFKWYLDYENDARKVLDPYVLAFDESGAYPERLEKTLNALFELKAPIPQDILFHVLKSESLFPIGSQIMFNFLNGKVDFNLKNKKGMTALDLVTGLSNTERTLAVTNALINNGANPNTDPDFTPLSACFLYRNRDLAQRWATKLDVSASLVGALMYDGYEKREDMKLQRLGNIAQVIEDFRAEQLYGVDSQGVSPLMAAVYANNEKAVKSLLAVGVDPKKVPDLDNDGEKISVLDLAYMQEVSPGIISLLSKVHAPSYHHETHYLGTPEVPQLSYPRSEILDKELDFCRKDGLTWIKREPVSKDKEKEKTVSKTLKP